MPFFSNGTFRLYYETHGDGPAVVFAHGRGGNHLNWWQQVPSFANTYKCITFDHREFGLSRDEPQGPGKQAYVEDLCGLLDHLSVEKAFLIGQSMGGWSCLGFAMAYPRRTAALVLTNTTGGIGDPSVVSILTRRGDSPDRKTTGPNFEGRQPEKAFLLKQLRVLNESLNPPLRESRQAFMTSAAGPKAADLAGIKVPTLFIGGMDDELFPPEVMSAAAKLVPGAELRLFDDAGHSVHYEHPHEFNACVQKFFDRSVALEVSGGRKY